MDRRRKIDSGDYFHGLNAIGLLVLVVIFCVGLLVGASSRQQFPTSGYTEHIAIVHNAGSRFCNYIFWGVMVDNSA